jgi:hypothetical protein
VTEVTITAAQDRVLTLIEDGFMTLKDISRESGTTVKTAKAHVNALLPLGLIEQHVLPPDGPGRPAHAYKRTSKPRPRKRSRSESQRMRAVARAPQDPCGTFDTAAPLTITSDPRWGIATREHVELVARKALETRPARNGRKAITARQLADQTGMPYLDALGALERITERNRKIHAYRPDGRSATFYTGRKYKPTQAFGRRQEA